MKNREMHSYQIVAYPELKNNPVVELIYPDGSSKTYLTGAHIRGVRQGSQRPVDVKWYDCNTVKVTEELREWIYNELAYVFPPKCFNEVVIPNLLGDTHE